MVGNNEIYKPLFMSDEDWQNNARLNIIHGFDLFTEGYKNAADILTINILENSRNQDTLVYPIVFLYRQHLELRLKEIIREGNAFLDDTPDYPKTHRLEKLWVQVKEIIRKVWLQEDSEEDSKEFDFIAHIVREFSMVDPESDSFS